MSKKRSKRGPKQLSFFKESPRSFGGSAQKSHPKFARTLSSKESIHLVLKSAHAVGICSMLRQENVHKVDAIIRIQAKICGIKIYQLVNVGNHLHLVIKLRDHKLFAQFIRAITGVIARHVLKRQRGPKKTSLKMGNETRKQFWVARPFTRLIAWGRDYNFVKNYMDKNRTQARNHFVAWGFDVTDIKKIRLLNTG
jgi:REP element-mobilizing transposase RayT